MSERTKFVLEWERRWNELEGRAVNIAELCRMFGVSRQTGHVWVRRFQQAGHKVEALKETSRRPHTNPRAVSKELEDFIVAARKQKPRWGPVLLRAWLVDRYPRISFPSRSCIAAILRKSGSTATKRIQPTEPLVVTPPFPLCEAPNEVWCMDFKGWFRTHDEERCYPFTLLDAYSRFLLRCEALLDPDGTHVMSILDSAFREYGLPKRMRSDGGPPFFAARSPASLSRVGIWLLRLGVILECIARGKPQQNGRLERFHRTLKLEVEPAESIREQQRAFNQFRRVYNFERPHMALSLVPPWTVYRRSAQKYPRALLRSEGMLDHVEEVDRRGFLSWRRRRIFIGEAFACELISLFPAAHRLWEIYFGAVLLGRMNEETQTFVPTRRPRGCMTLSFDYTDRWEPMKEEP